MAHALQLAHDRATTVESPGPQSFLQMSAQDFLLTSQTIERHFECMHYSTDSPDSNPAINVHSRIKTRKVSGQYLRKVVLLPFVYSNRLMPDHAIRHRRLTIKEANLFVVSIHHQGHLPF